MDLDQKEKKDLQVPNVLHLDVCSFPLPHLPVPTMHILSVGAPWHASGQNIICLPGGIVQTSGLGRTFSSACPTDSSTIRWKREQQVNTDPRTAVC